MNHIFFEGGIETGQIILNDLINRKDVIIIYRDRAFKSKFLSLLFNIHLSQKVNKLIRLPFKRLWFNKLISSNIPEGQQCIFTFIAGWFDEDLLSWLRKKYPNCKQILFLRDTVNVYERAIPSFRVDKLKSVFDVIISYNPEDCKKYNFTYSPVYISKYDEEALEKHQKSDVVFIGVAKDRLELLHSIYNKLESNGLKCDFYITNVKEEEKKYPNSINYANEYMKYEEYLGREVSSDCILEVIKGDTQGGTYRCWEAVYYNKKLITNWKGIKDFKFYDERYMLYFEDADDIDMQFFRENNNVDYNYNGENSPVNLLKILENS